MIIVMISILLIFAFTGYSIIGYGFIPAESAVIIEIIVYLLFLISLIIRSAKGGKFQFDLAWIYLFFILVAIASAINNNILTFSPIYSLRLYLRFYVLYLAIINFNFSDSQLRKIANIIFFLLIMQIPVQLIKFSFWGISEDTIGSYALHGGGITPTIAIIGLAFASGYYRFYKKSKIYLILGLFFISYGVLGNKRIVLYLYPIAFFCLYYLLYIKQNLDRNKIGAVIAFFMIFITTLSTGALILKYNSTLNPEKKVGGSINLKYAFEYSKQYEGNMLTKHSATGRYNTLKIVFTELADGGFARILFGFGPGTLTMSIFGNEMRYSQSLKRIAECYGQTGLTHVISEYGILSLFSFFPFFMIVIFRSWQYFKKELDPYWKAFSSFCLVFLVLQFILFTCYNTTPLLNSTVSPTFFCTLAILFSKQSQLKMQNRDLASSSRIY